MKFKHRLLIFVLGGFAAAYGIVQFQHSRGLPYLNRRMEPVLPAGVIVIGICVAAFAFLPSGTWVYRLLKRGTRPQPHVLRKANRHYN